MKRQAYNPYLPSGEYVPDGEPHVFDDRIYIYGSHDKFNGTLYCENDYVCWSAPVTDLSDWQYEGVIYKKNQDPINSDGKMQLWAPDIMVGFDGRYYLYYCFPFYPVIGVAVCDCPCGSFDFYGWVKYEDGTVYGQRKGDVLPFDPGVLNDQGTFFLYSNYSQNTLRMLPEEFAQPVLDGMKTLEDTMKEFVALIGDDAIMDSLMRINGYGSKVLKLAEDMLTVQSVNDLIPGIDNSENTGFEGHEFYEASSIRKIGEKYYFIYSSYLSHELCYAISDKPDKDFVYGGTIISNGDVGLPGVTKIQPHNYYGNNHGGLVKCDGSWYIFYHRHTDCNEQSRQGCAEPVTIADDGSISQVEMTSCGLNGEPLSGKGTYPSYIACNLAAVSGACKYDASNPEAAAALKAVHPYITQDVADIEVPSYDKQVQYIRNMRQGTKIGFKYFQMQGVTTIEVETRGNSGKLIVSTSWDGPSYGEILLDDSAYWRIYSTSIEIPNGKQALYFTYQGTGAIDFKSFTLG